MQPPQQMQQNNAQILQAEAQKTLDMRPEWTDPDIRGKAMSDMSDFVQKQYGYTPDDMQRISDHRVFNMIEDAMAYQAIKTNSKPKIKKAVPKFQKPGGHKPAGGKKAKLDKLYKKAAASSDRKVKDDAITQLLLNS